MGGDVDVGGSLDGVVLVDGLGFSDLGDGVIPKKSFLS